MEYRYTAINCTLLVFKLYNRVRGIARIPNTYIITSVTEMAFLTFWKNCSIYLMLLYLLLISLRMCFKAGISTLHISPRSANHGPLVALAKFTTVFAA